MNPKTFLISYAMDDTIKTTQLGYDAFHGRLIEVQSAIDSKIDWSMEGVNGIHGAIFGGQLECFKIILAAGSPVNAYTHYLLCKILPLAYEKYFLDSKYLATLDKTTATTNLVESCIKGSLVLCSHFLKAGADPNLGEYGVLPLITAARKFRIDLIKLLLDHGALINHTGKGRHSPLRHLSSSGSHLDTSIRREAYEFMVLHGAIAIPPFTEKEKLLAEQGLHVSMHV